MNPRQRRGVLLMIAAALGAIVVFVAVVGYLGSIRAEVGEKTEVLQLKQAVPAYTTLTPDMFQKVMVPQKWTPNTMIRDVSALNGQVAGADLPVGAYLQYGMLVSAPALQPGQREIAIIIDAETGVAGKVHPGSIVDIYGTFPAAAKRKACATRIIRMAKVIQVGQLTAQRTSDSAKANEVVPITFALSDADSLTLTYAETNATKVRLALIGGNDTTAPRVGQICDPVVAR
jgi:pilus assembly protein CpaB